MNLYQSADDIIYQKFIGGKIHLIISFVAGQLLLFEFTGIGSWTVGLAIEVVQDYVSNFSLSFRAAFEGASLLILLIPGFLIWFFTFIPFYIFLGILYMPLIKAALFVSEIAGAKFSTLQKLLNFYAWEASKWDKLREAEKTKNYFKQELINKVGRVEDFYLDYLMKDSTLEYVETYSKLSLQKFEKKLSKEHSKLNTFFKWNELSSFSFFGGCEHGIVEEIYCRYCHQIAKDKDDELVSFLAKYRKEAKHKSQEQSKRSNSQKPKNEHKINLDNRDLELLDLEYPFTLKALKQKRNIALKRNHPDLVANMSKELQKFAKLQTQEIIEAYERLEKLAEK